MLGTWTCRYTTIWPGRGPGRIDTNVNAMVLDGQYMMTTTTSKPFDKMRTKTLVNQSWLTYNRKDRLWYWFEISNFGGFETATSPGWNGNEFVLTDTYSSEVGRAGVTTITKVSPGELSIAFVVPAKPTIATREVCTKSPSGT